MTTFEIAIFFCLPLLCLALLVLRAVVFGYETVASRSWPSANAVIEESSIQIDHDFESDVVIRFKFYVAQQPYWGNQVIRVNRTYDRDQLDTEYPIGKKVSIVYDPNDPDTQSKLNPNQ